MGALALALAVALAAAAALAWQLHVAARRERERGDALRAALEARLWEERVLEIDALQATVQDLRRRTHEANNAFSTALLSAQYLLDSSRTEPFSAEVRGELVSAAAGMVDALQKLRGQLDRGPKPSTTAGARSPLVQPVELWLALERCAATAAARHGSVSVRLLPAGDGVREARIGVCGGSAGLERALACAVDNAAACGRTRVELRALAPPGIDVVAIEVVDDGPHFPDDRLARPVVPFDAARPGELEVALYTAERILRASLGSLRRENLDGGGARVSLFFPVVPERTPD